jgi:F-type H+-transporting ATPase subunit a
MTKMPVKIRVMQNNFFKNASYLGFAISFLTAAAFWLILGQGMAALGVLVGALWVFLNSFFLFQLIEMSIASKTVKKDRILLLTIIKFPFLYLLGYFILSSRHFPVMSLLVGLTIFFFSLLFFWLRHNATRSIAILLLFVILGIGNVYASEATHGGGHESEHGSGPSMHVTNLVGLVSHFAPKPVGDVLLRYENLFFGILVILILGFVFYFASRKISLVPGRLQLACEGVVAWLDDFVCGILGPQGKKYTPFLGTMFLYIWVMNLIGLLPLMKSNTANSITLPGPVPLPIPTTTAALALIVFFYVQGVGIKNQGIIGYLDHMAGTPRDVFGFVMMPIMFPIHLIGELAKPFSLTFRLFCNIMGGHILVAVFIGMAISAAFIPFQAPFLLFEIATSTIQAFVFTLLSTVYIAMMLPHHDEKHGHEHSVTGHRTRSAGTR